MKLEVIENNVRLWKRREATKYRGIMILGEFINLLLTNISITGRISFGGALQDVDQTNECIKLNILLQSSLASYLTNNLQTRHFTIPKQLVELCQSVAAPNR